MYIFGSYAYGTPNDDSDLDIAIVDERTGDDSFDIEHKISLLLFPRSYSLDVVAINPKRLNDLKTLSFWKEIFDKGKLFYERCE